MKAKYSNMEITFGYKAVLCISYITDQPIQLLLRALYTDIIKSEINFKSKNKNIPYIWFSIGIDHSNPYIHSTTVLCDTAYTYIHACIYMHKDVQLVFATI